MLKIKNILLYNNKVKQKRGEKNKMKETKQRKTKKHINKKMGISLIVLVITIIVMIILAAAVILSLSSNGIIDRANEAVRRTNKAQIETLAQTIWADGYLENKTAAQIKEDIVEAVGKDEAKYYSIVVNGSGVTVEELPEDWVDSVSEIVNGVPIPKGFVISPYDGENTVNEGLVIYALTTQEIANGVYDITKTDTDTTHQDSLENRNQFVWVPVSKTNFATEFVRERLGFNLDSWYGVEGLNEEEKWYSNTLGTSNLEQGYFWEVELDDENMPKATQSNMNYMSDYTLKEVQAMYASVKKYGGFYIARYEVGATDVDDTTKFARSKDETVSVTMGKYPYNGVSWATSNTMNFDEGGAVQLAREFYAKTNTNYGVVSTLTYGVQWDRTLAWIKSIKDDDFSLLNSSEYGNYANTSLAATDFNENAQYVSASSNNDSATTGYYDVGTWTEATNFTSRSGNYIMTTGALAKANVCNIYDMAGNLCEWTMEGYSSNRRVSRGGGFYFGGSVDPVAARSRNVPAYIYASFGFRPSLYIKQHGTHAVPKAKNYVKLNAKMDNSKAYLVSDVRSTSGVKNRHRRPKKVITTKNMNGKIGCICTKIAGLELTRPAMLNNS